MFFDGWSGLFRVLAVGVPAYVALVIFLRLSGKRTLSKMNAFDLVVTVALGSTLASVITSETVALAEGMLALGMLIFLQFVVAWSAVRSRLINHAVKSEPRMLLYRGQLLHQAMREERVVESEVRAAVRAAGTGDLESVESVVLETDGSFSVIPSDKTGEGSAMAGLDRAPLRS